MQEYRERWTSGNHNFGRTYLGQIGDPTPGYEATDAPQQEWI